MPAQSDRPRVAFYSHDSVGLGHIRRNLALAEALGRLPEDPDLLLVSGTADAARLQRPGRADIVTLPALAKGRDGRYGARSLGLGLDDLLAVRAAVIAAAVRSFAPDLLIVDRHARGFGGELEPALDAVAGRTRIVLGLRDVLDAPEVVRAEWEATETDAALARWYDEVWTFTDPAIVDPLGPLGGTRPVPVRATGYLADPLPAPHPPSCPSAAGSAPDAADDRPLVVGMVGGGADGGELAHAFVTTPLPAGTRAALVCGPQMPEAEHRALEALAHGRRDLCIIRSMPDARPLLAAADAVVAMAGYNTAAEILASDVPALLVPRVVPRTEQRIRAQAFAARGLAQTIDPADATPDAIGAWLDGALPQRPTVDRSVVARDGLTQVAAHGARLLGVGA